MESTAVPAISLVVITDGRFDFLRATLRSMDEHLAWPWRRRVMVNDSGDPAYAAQLASTYPHFVHVDHLERRGYAGAVASAWHAAGECDYIFHLEDDFRIARRVDLGQIREVLSGHPYLVQIALLRDAVSPEERLAGGIIQTHPDAFSHLTAGSASWIEHRRFFTTNPSLVPRWVTLREFGEPPGAEGRFGEQLFAADPSYHSAFWGSGETWIEHLGAWRTRGWQE